MTTRDGLPTMTTYTGRRFNFLMPEVASIDLEDIAHGLSQICRFAAQASPFYSVAQHSVLVSKMVGKTGDPEVDLKLQKIGLFHDSAEAYVGDLASPLKKLIPFYSKIERDIYVVIARKFGIPQAIPAEVKEADSRLLANEGQSFMSPDWRDAKADPDPALGRIDGMAPVQAKEAFKARYRELFGDWKGGR